MGGDGRLLGMSETRGELGQDADQRQRPDAFLRLRHKSAPSVGQADEHDQPDTQRQSAHKTKDDELLAFSQIGGDAGRSGRADDLDPAADSRFDVHLVDSVFRSLQVTLGKIQIRLQIVDVGDLSHKILECFLDFIELSS